MSSTVAASQKGGIAAIACSEIDSLVFDPSRTPFYPSGSWTRLQLSNSSLTLRRCGMLPTGEIAILFPLQKTLMLRLPNVDLPTFFQMDSLQGKTWDLVPARDRFLVLSDSGLSFVLYSHEDTADWILSELLRHPFGGGSFTDTTIRFAASSTSFIKVDGTRVVVAQLNGAKGVPPYSPLVSNLQSVFVNPCNDNQACPPSMSTVDDSWTLSGYFGHYVGAGPRHQRLNIPLAASKSDRRLSGVAIAHSHANGTFLYIGNDDGDYGSMIQALASVSLSPSRRSPAREYLYPSIITPFDGLVKSKPEQGPPWWPIYLNVSGACKLLALAKAVPARVRVGLVDSGSTLSHPWLTFFENPEEIPGNLQDDDDDGLVDDVQGFDYVQETCQPIDGFGHGTHVSGILLGRDPLGAVPLAPASLNMELSVYRALDRYGLSNSIDLARALEEAADDGVEVIK
jgi:hypothetical protein